MHEKSQKRTKSVDSKPIGRHENTELTLERFICSRCGKDFKNRRSLSAHKRSHNPEDLKNRLQNLEKGRETYKNNPQSRTKRSIASSKIRHKGQKWDSNKRYPRESVQSIQEKLTKTKGSSYVICGDPVYNEKTKLYEYPRKHLVCGTMEYLGKDKLYKKNCSNKECFHKYLSNKRAKDDQYYQKKFNSLNGQLQYLGVDRTGKYVKYNIKCCKCGHEFKTVIQNNINGAGCPMCYSRSTTSKWEQEVRDYIESLGFETTKIKIRYREVDIYIPKLRIGFECNGLYFHRMGISNNYPMKHRDKTTICLEHGIKLYHIWDYVCMKDIEKIISDILFTGRTDYRTLFEKEGFIDRDLHPDYEGDIVDPVKTTVNGFEIYNSGLFKVA